MLTADPQYTAATEGVALIDRSDRGKLAVSGLDAAAYLDSLLSNDVAGVAPGGGVDATLLTHKGRMLAEVRVPGLPHGHGALRPHNIMLFAHHVAVTGAPHSAPERAPGFGANDRA